MTESVMPTAAAPPPGRDETADAPAAVKSHGMLGWHLVSLATGVACGCSVLLIAHKYYGARVLPAPVIESTAELAITPNADFTAKLVAAVGQARDGGELLIAARALSSERLLKAMQQRSKQLTIKVLLDPEFNRSPDTGAAAWLTRNKVAAVYFDAIPSTNQFVVIDGTFVYLGTTPFTADAPTNMATSGVFETNPALARQLRDYFYGRLAQARSRR